MKNQFKLFISIIGYLAVYNAHCQTPPVLNSASNFSIIASGEITSSFLINTMGKVGSSNNVSPNVSSTGGVFINDSTVLNAINDVTIARNQCSSKSGTLLPNNLNNLTLNGGVYNISGSAYLNQNLNLNGDSNSIFIFNISDSLIIDSGAIINCNSNNIHHIYWNIINKAYLRANSFFNGIVMAGSNIIYDARCEGSISLFTIDGSVLIDFTKGFNQRSINLYSPAFKSSVIGSNTSVNNQQLPLNCTWSRHEGGFGYDLGYDITTDINGDIYVSGNFTSSANFSSNIFNTNPNNYNLFVAKYDFNGNLIWINNINVLVPNGFTNNPVSSVITDNNGNVYICGRLQNNYNYSFGSSVPSLSGPGYFIASYNSGTGVINWANRVLNSSLNFQSFP